MIQGAASNPHVYTDLSGLQSISRLGRDNSAAGLRKVAEQFESLFINMMLKEMRQSHASLFADNYLSSNEMNFHQQNYDNQISMHLAGAGGIGLADTLHRQMMQRFDVSEQEPATSVRPSRLVAPAAVAARITREAPVPVQQKTFESPESFVEQLLPLARDAADRLGVDAQALIAQSALETGWGQRISRHSDGSSSHNLFGIKADSRWSGERVSVNTLEFRDGVARHERASFRAYSSFEESFNDYVHFLENNPRYAEALSNAQDSENFLQHLQDAGYATDPEYAQKIQGVMHSPIMQRAMAGGLR